MAGHDTGPGPALHGAGAGIVRRLGFGRVSPARPVTDARLSRGATRLGRDPARHETHRNATARSQARRTPSALVPRPPRRHRPALVARGRLLIVANHPSGALDALALLDCVGKVRRDGLVYANDGDWVESLSALAEEADGTLHLLSHRGETLAKIPPRLRLVADDGEWPRAA